MADNKKNDKEEKGKEKIEQPDATKTQMGDGGQMTEKTTGEQPTSEKTPAALPQGQQEDEEDDDEE